MDEKEFNNTYAIPANYTDSGKLDLPALRQLAQQQDLPGEDRKESKPGLWAIPRSHGCMWIPRPR